MVLVACSATLITEGCDCGDRERSVTDQPAVSGEAPDREAPDRPRLDVECSSRISVSRARSPGTSAEVSARGRLGSGACSRDAAADRSRLVIEV
jgi:hypothetical protein